VLFREFHRSDGEVDHLQIVMPVSLRIAFIRQLHEPICNTVTTHLGIKKTQWHVGQRAYWSNWRFDIERYGRRSAVR